ncbi:MAG: hypothetical protein M1839_006117 [Geoglossum umbratile]|nr:MAG: hypothetical protein M1839_006117 [Geoglossum umbratile]
MSVPMQVYDGGGIVLDEYQKRAVFDSHLRRSGRRFSGVTWGEYVGVLRDDKDPSGYTREGMRSRKRRIIADYRWDDEIGELIYKKSGTIAVPEHRIYDIIESEYDGSGKVSTKLHTRCVSPKYHNITALDVRKWLELQPSNLGGCPLPHLTSEHDASSGRGKGIRPVEQAPPRPSCTSGNEAPVANRDRLPFSGGRAVRLLREEFKNRRWPKELIPSPYVDLISGLHMILGAATPANSYFKDDQDQDTILSAPYDSADLLCLTAQQSIVELENSEDTLKPIFIRHGAMATEDLQTIDSYLKDLSGYLSVTVQDLSRKRDQSSGVLWPTSKVISRFEGQSEQPDEQAPINIPDLGCTRPNVVPKCFCSGNMQFLSRLAPHAGRQLESLGSLSTKVEKWCLLDQAGSGTMTHQDHCGLWTWVRVEQGKKLWFICNLLGGERQTFAEQGAAFVGGRWFYVWLEPGDVLIIPPGTIHAAYTPVNTLYTGGNAWSQKHMGDSMRAIAFEDAHPNVTNNKTFAQLPEILQEVARRMETPGSAADFGGEEQIWRFNHYYKEYKEAAAQREISNRPDDPQEHPSKRRRYRVANGGPPKRSVTERPWRAGAAKGSTPPAERMQLKHRD